ncbi:putative hexaprenyl pyrophosphate synthetase Coq1 [Xylona heveae TC161]|uniref:Putative hexaprenyl pyrophosphate synthetase Coq1 n=1 Tax=Xylona heveae (strain CBS 132557 / TC161) TaxID=1328760 RepID=A0A165G6D8_XYLHT|nr:putative hexaprenyl pyrophosphate synthetase Coq1 [Xylona heveae TC161]KZF21792.1 putative hexaprenyl pyrophosphate synthetase Coq1 [Xylona heveae TC161]
MGFRPSRASGLFRSSFTAQQRPRISTCPQCTQSLSFRTRATPITNFNFTHQRKSSTWTAAVSAAQNLMSAASASSKEAAAQGVSVDPLRIVAKEMKFLTKNIRQLLGSGHPTLDTVAKYYTHAEGKHMRPLVVLLMSRATALTPTISRQSFATQTASVDSPISPSSILLDNNPSFPETNPLTTEPASFTSTSAPDSDILPSQRRLAEITELIHTASLLHDDVIDTSEARRGSPSANIEFGNKMAVLAGDFLLGRASIALARLRDPEVIELMATVIANLVEGEFMQLKNTARDEKYPKWTEETISYYLQKTYLKTASLISKSSRSAALLGQNTPEVVEAAYQFGRNLGLAFQLVDDMLDYTVSAQELGKPAGADLELGLATAPLLFAWKNEPELGALVGRKFSKEGDVLRARELVARSDGVEQTRALAQDYADKAVAAISPFPESEAKDGLIEICVKTMNRRK